MAETPENTPTPENMLIEGATKAQKIALAAVATTVAEPALWLAHFGGPGVIAGLIVGGFAYAYSDEIATMLGGKGKSPLPIQGSKETTLLEEKQSVSERKARSLAYRLFVGKTQREEVLQENSEPTFTELYEELTAEDNDCLHLGELRPHANSIFSNRIAILGMPGAGKSNLVGVFAEELGKYDAALIIFDKKPEYEPLCQRPYLANPFRANASNLSPQNAYAFGQRIMKERLQVVVDLASYKNDAAAALVMINLVESVGTYQEALSNEERVPCTFIVEEAHYWFPESEGLSTIKSVKVNTGQALLSMLQQTYFNLANLGRSYGMGLIVSTQRPANVDKRLINGAEWRFLLKAMEPLDLKTYKTYGLEATQAMNLDPKQGQAYVIGPDVRGVYQIRRRRSPDEAKTPGLENIRREQSTSSTSFSTSQASSVSTSLATTPTTSDQHSLVGEISGLEVAQTAARSVNEVDVVAEVENEVDSEAGNGGLTDREIQIANMFFLEKKSPGQIAKSLCGGKAGDAYQQAAAEVSDAIRKFVEVQIARQALQKA